MKQDVAEPDEIGVQQAEHHQPGTSAEKDGRESRAARLGAMHHQHQSGPVQHREDAHELLVEEQVREVPHAHVYCVATAHDQRVVIGCQRHRERVDVHDQDAHHGNTAQGVKGKKPLGGSNGAGIRHSERFRITHQVVLLYPGFPAIFPWIS